MAKVNPLTHLFNTGEISKAALNRVDKDALRLYAERQENLLPSTIGKATMRPGTQFLGYSGGAANGTSGRIIGFNKSPTERALLEFTNARLRIWVDDVLISRSAVTSTVTNGDFSSGVGWTLTVTGDAVANINSTVAGMLYMQCPNVGGIASCTRSVTTSSAGTEHGLRVTVNRGPVTFRCGSSSGADDYITECSLDTGIYSFGFTPSGTYHVYFETRLEVGVIVDSVQVESAGNIEITAPWVSSELREIRHAQSLDVVFLAHNNWRQRLIQRFGARSWGLTEYKVDDGPFTTTRTAKVKLKPGATRGNTTLTADAAFFRAEHVGALFRLDQDGLDATFGIGAEESYTKPFRITGIRSPSFTYPDDRNFTYATTGTWVGTLTSLRSIDDKDFGYRNYPFNVSSAASTFSVNVSVTNQGLSDDNNLISWHKFGFRTGDYTSGSVRFSINYDGHSDFGIARVTSFNSATSVNVEVLRDFPNTNYTSIWLEGEWSDYRGWPSAVGFFDGRLFWARDDKFWGSESDDYFAFNTETEGDAGSIQRNIAVGDESATAQWILPLQRLIIGCDGQVAAARSSNFDEPLTPTNVTIKPVTTVGAGALPAVKYDSRGVFIELSGRKIYEVAYNVDAQDYIANELTRLHEDMWMPTSRNSSQDDGFAELVVQRTPEPYLWAVRDDGVAYVLLYNPNEEARGWSRVTTGHLLSDTDLDVGVDRIISIAVLRAVPEDEVFFLVERKRSGSTFYSIEKMSTPFNGVGTAQYIFNPLTNEMEFRNAIHLADSHFSVDATGTQSFSIPQLANSDVMVIGLRVDGSHNSNQPSAIYTADASGNFTITEQFSGNVIVGLPYAGYYKSAKLAYGAQKGTALTQPKLVDSIGLVLLDTHPDALRVGREFADESDMDQLPRLNSDLSDVDPEAVSSGTQLATMSRAGEQSQFPFPGEWNTDSRVHIYARPGYSACLCSLVMGIDTAER